MSQTNSTQTDETASESENYSAGTPIEEARQITSNKNFQQFIVELLEKQAEEKDRRNTFRVEPSVSDTRPCVLVFHEDSRTELGAGIARIIDEYGFRLVGITGGSHRNTNVHLRKRE